MSNQGLPIDQRSEAIYRAQSIEVFASRIVVHATQTHRTSYAIQQIVSVGLRKEDANLALPAILILGGLIFGGAGLSIVNRTSAVAMLVIGVVCIALGAWLWYATKPTYNVVVGLSSGDKVTLPAEGQSVAEALEGAIVRVMAAK